MTPKRPHKKEPMVGMDKYGRAGLSKAKTDMHLVSSIVHPGLEPPVHPRN